MYDATSSSPFKVKFFSDIDIFEWYFFNILILYKMPNYLAITYVKASHGSGRYMNTSGSKFLKHLEIAGKNH